MTCSSTQTFPWTGSSDFPFSRTSRLACSFCIQQLVHMAGSRAPIVSSIRDGVLRQVYTKGKILMEQVSDFGLRELQGGTSSETETDSNEHSGFVRICYLRSALQSAFFFCRTSVTTVCNCPRRLRDYTVLLISIHALICNSACASGSYPTTDPQYERALMDCARAADQGHAEHL